jgi:histidinol-phosphate aminotransferase
MPKDRLSVLIKKEVLGLTAYNTEAIPCPVRLDANENPFPLPRELHEEFISAIRGVSLNRYPELGSFSLAKRLAEACGVESDMLMLGNGSDELIQVLCASLTSSTVLIPTPTFIMYRLISLNNGHKTLDMPLNVEFDLDLDAMLKQVKDHSPALIFLSYPNNPTGNCFSEEKIEAILKKARGLVVVDEAYSNFSGKSFLPFLKKYKNLVILKTLSKIGFAALRIGFLIGRASLVRELSKVRLPYNINAISQVGVSFYLKHESVFLEQAAEIIKRREELYLALQKIEGIRPYPSSANFIFFHCLFDTDQIYSELIRRGILIRNFGSAGNLKNCMRVTVGKQEENEAFLDAIKCIIARLGV